MPRLPYAANVLIEQVRDKYGRKADSDAGLETGKPVGDPDGFDVQRSVEFDKTSSKFLAKALPVLEDSRITGFDEKAGKITVHFAGGPEADNADPFPLEDAALVAAQDQPDEEPDGSKG